mmetsp:Transcript_17744/g.40961  ORF Transcript_17744/g.40961 Transcript_17744/m.40961 type:complete len:212 (+) Transcript_17744:116-751(+)|eukprot:CAMPEP_0197187876 /NCGR_PEP_ID=MMETSP1423-20130617/16763_1 /TAXON_ID=476441 /ORGANISM="Pseudo-nitzschia heimii, Strain UNC1101" /LENGTH=211 /DNA_ID=CAMNT_0042639573 /DNA_START=67 /DNA_END=702 /DNA_ORIENTATION=-
MSSENTLCARESIDPSLELVVRHGADEETSLPRNFSFLWKNEVALSSIPVNADQIRAWKEVFKVSLVVTLTKESLPPSWFRDIDCTNLHVPVTDNHPLSNDQMDVITEAIVDSVRAGGSAVIHCFGGKGRTGTVGACLLMRYGSRGILRGTCGGTGTTAEEETPISFDAADAIDFLRTIRPGSIESESQEVFIREYENVLQNGTTKKNGDS